MVYYFKDKTTTVFYVSSIGIYIGKSNRNKKINKYNMAGIYSSRRAQVIVCVSYLFDLHARTILCFI